MARGMPRNAKTDIGGLTQWLARKCRNHNPLSQMKERRAARPLPPQIGVAVDGSNRVYYEHTGRWFVITVEEVGPGVVPDLLGEVGS